MTVSSSGNAMTEVALALAMAFFSIMILTMVSMSSGNVVGFSPKIFGNLNPLYLAYARASNQDIPVTGKFSVLSAYCP